MDSEDPDPDSILGLILILVLLVMLSAFFSATETAYSAVNKTKLKIKAQDGHKGAKNAFALAENYDRLISSILIGNNIVNITLATLSTILFAMLLSGDKSALAPTISTIVTTIVVLIFGEIIPKMIAKEKSEAIAIATGYPIRFFMFILFPLSIAFSGLKFIIRKVFKLQNEEKITEEEILNMVEEAQEEGSLDKSEQELISSSIEFDDVLVEDILVPRVGIVAVSVDMSMEQIKQLFLEHNFSRMPVYRGTIDSIIGMIHNIDFFAAWERGEKNIRGCIKPTAVATAHMKISTLLKSMQRQKVHMAIVVDEYGGTLGIATLEDILEELVGEIWDEHDEIINYFTKIDDTHYTVDGRAELDNFFNLFGFDDDECDKFDSQTVSGWVIEMMGIIPKKMEKFEYRNLLITITKLTQRKILEVKVLVKPEETSEEGEG